MGISSSLGSSALLPAGLGFRNTLTNGSFLVDQRNSSAAQTITAAAVLAYTTDRWYAYCTGANVTSQRIAGSAPFQYNHQFTGATSNTLVGFGQRIEAANSFNYAGATATLSAYIKSSSLTSVTWTLYYATTTDSFGTIASPTRTQIATGTFTISSVLTRFSTQIAVPAAATTGLELVFTTGALVASQTLVFAGVQLEQNYQATPFEQRPIGVELELCQRYYEDSVTTTSTVGANVGIGGNTYCAPTFFKVTKRIAPTSVNGANDTSGNIRMWNNLGSAGSISYYQGGWTYAHTTMTMDWFGIWGFSLTTIGGLTDADLIAFRYAYSAEL